MSATRLIQISDPHVVAPGRLVSGLLDTSTLFERAIDRILHDLPRYDGIDAVIVTGDITDDGAPDSYAFFRQQIDRLGLPCFVIPGNHDDREALLGALGDLGPVPRSGPVNWLHDLGPLRLVGLDTLIPGEGRGKLDAETLDFAEDALATRSARPALIALHHPPFPCGIRFMDRLGLEGIAGLEQVLTRQAGADMRLICGHIHSLAIATLGPASAVSCPSTCSSFSADFRADAPIGFIAHPGGYMVHVWQDGFTSTHVPFGPEAPTAAF